MKKRLVKSSVFAILPLLLISCSDNSKFYFKVDEDFGVTTQSTIQINDRKELSSVNSEYVKFHGRHYFDENLKSTWFDYSLSGFEVTFTGTTLVADFYATNANSDENRPYLGVSIDGDYDPNNILPIKLSTNSKGENGKIISDNISLHESIKLVENLTDSIHTLRIYKRSECTSSHVALKAISTDGIINPVVPKELDYKIEVFGDSVTCGYAVDSSDYYQKFCTQIENSTKSFANLAANKLKADASFISCGGYPVYKSKYSSTCKPSSIPEMFSLSSVEWVTSTQHVWDNSLYVPDVVVIALGANDCSIYNELTNEEDKNIFKENFKNTYLNFLTTIQKTYPTTHIVVSEEIIPINIDIENASKEIVEDFNKKNSGELVTYCEINAFNNSQDRTCPGAGHPNEEMHSLASEELYLHIKEILNI